MTPLDQLVFVLLDTKPNRHSLNALVGALETDSQLQALELLLPATEDQLGQQLAELQATGKRAVVGVSLTTLQASRVGEMLQRLRGLRKPIPGGDDPLWVAGGPHPTASPEDTLAIGFDIVVRGEGEATLLDLLKTVAAGANLDQVPGIVFRDRCGQPRTTAGRSEGIDLNAYPPFPLWRRQVVGPIEITRGCPFACGYCQTSHLLGRRPRHRNIEVIARFAAVIRQAGLRDVRVITPNAFSYGSADGRSLNLPALEGLLAALRETLGGAGRLFFGTFPSEVRPEHVNQTTLGLVKRYANNGNLLIGAQSGSQRMLDRCGRGHTVEDVFQAAAGTVAAGLVPLVDFIFGLPGETPDDLQSTVDVIRRLAGMGAKIHAHTFMPLPQTRFAQAPPGKIPGRLRLVVKELIRQDALFGIWHRQQGEAQRIARRDGPGQGPAR